MNPKNLGLLIAVSVCAWMAFGQRDTVAFGQKEKNIYKAPTAADWAALSKLPDFSGVWERGAAPVAQRGAAPAAPAAQRGAAPAAPAGQRGAAPAAQGGAARGAAAGGGRGGGLQLTPPYEARRREYQSVSREDTETANCLPPGMPGIMGQPYPMEFLLTPGKVTIVIEAYTQVRHIYTDGRPLPDDPDPRFYGTSIGRWDGDTLVVESVGFSQPIQNGVYHSDKMKIVERYRLADPDTMTIETTITDPEALAAPYVTNATLRRHRDWTISEYICQENNRNSVDASGKAGIDPTLPGQKED